MDVSDFTRMYVQGSVDLLNRQPEDVRQHYLSMSFPDLVKMLSENQLTEKTKLLCVGAWNVRRNNILRTQRGNI